MCLACCCCWAPGCCCQAVRAQRAHEVGHLNGGDGCLASLVADFAASTVQRLSGDSRRGNGGTRHVSYQLHGGVHTQRLQMTTAVQEAIASQQACGAARGCNVRHTGSSAGSCDAAHRLQQHADLQPLLSKIGCWQQPCTVVSVRKAAQATKAGTSGCHCPKRLHTGTSCM